MPELPEVETVRSQLADQINGREIADIEVRNWKSVKQDRYFVRQLVGQTIVALDRKGKYLFVELSDDNSWLMIHLKMTGRLIFQPAEANRVIGGGHHIENPPESYPHQHTRIIFRFADDSYLYFNDMRKFGWVRRVNNSEIQQQKQRLGPEPLTADYTNQTLQDVLSGRNTSLKSALLKQQDIAGLGNIYVDESCYRAGIRPDRTAGNVSKRAVQSLYDATQSVLADALAYGGTTFRDYTDTGGEYGNFTDRLQVFDREGEPCNRCEATIEKIRCAGRGTHLCPQCQA